MVSDSDGSHEITSGQTLVVFTQFTDVYVGQIDKECLTNLGHYNIKAVTIDVGFHVDGDVLEVNETGGDLYQWKIDGVVDASATSFSIAAQEEKTYQVHITKNGCTKDSKPFLLTGLNDETSILTISPNPAFYSFTISLPAGKFESLDIRDNVGRNVLTQAIGSSTRQLLMKTET